ncbi:MAG TPA: response regulator [Anaeromyxobacteraceae bacterium]|nr:response regulator [Anaeromyxobacteraceae bacterium]
MKVLIADDDQTIRALLSDMLVDLGHLVVAAVNGAEAVELAVREQPEVVILDFLMPKLSGLDALKAMRARGLSMPAVFLTAISDSSMREVEGFEAPAAILEKPFKKKTIERALARATGALPE